MRDIGFNAVRPRIEQISFKKTGYMALSLADGRVVYIPLTRFPNLERLTPAERRRYHIADGEVVLFHDDDEVYHIQDFLGTYETNVYRSTLSECSIHNQLQIDFLAAFRRMLVSLGNDENLPFNESMFVKLTTQWENARVMPTDLLFQKSPVEAVVFRLQKDDRESGLNRLKFPADLIAGELRGTPGLTGFSAMFREQGWVILPAELPGMYKNLFLNILAASIGLESAYASRTELLVEAERVALAVLLPELEIRKFFGIRLSRFPDSFRTEVANYYNLPFDYVLKRANHLGLVSEAVLEEARTDNKPARSTTLRKPISSQVA